MNLTDWLFGRRDEVRDRAFRLLELDLQDTQAHNAQLAKDRVAAIKRADTAEAEAELAREALTAGHRELLAEKRRLAAKCKQLTEANRLLNRQLNDAMGYGPSELAVIDAGGEQALAAIEKATRKPITTA